MRKLIKRLLESRKKTPAKIIKTEREKKLEREWADLLRYEGRPLYEKDED